MDSTLLCVIELSGCAVDQNANVQTQAEQQIQNAKDFQDSVGRWRQTLGLKKQGGLDR